ILNTRDGGATWQVQHTGGGRAAVLWLNHDGRDVPLSAVARYGGEDGYHNVALALTMPSLTEDVPGAINRPARFADAFRAVGGSTAEVSGRFPLPSDQTNNPIPAILESWNPLHEGKATQEIERELVLAIRLWRPEVVVTDWIEPTAQTPAAAALVALGARKAF